MYEVSYTRCKTRKFAQVRARKHAHRDASAVGAELDSTRCACGRRQVGTPIIRHPRPWRPLHCDYARLRLRSDDFAYADELAEFVTKRGVDSVLAAAQDEKATTLRRTGVTAAKVADADKVSTDSFPSGSSDYSQGSSISDPDASSADAAEAPPRASPWHSAAMPSKSHRPPTAGYRRFL